MNLANFLTVSRIILSPLICSIFMYCKSFGWSVFNLALLIFAFLTDWMDGFFARKEADTGVVNRRRSKGRKVLTH